MRENSTIVLSTETVRLSRKVISIYHAAESIRKRLPSKSRNKSFNRQTPIQTELQGATTSSHPAENVCTVRPFCKRRAAAWARVRPWPMRRLQDPEGEGCERTG